jgi:hypothetical protein
VDQETMTHRTVIEITIIIGLIFVLVALISFVLFPPVCALEFNTSLPGDRNLGDSFTWAINNVSNNASVRYFFTVEAARVLGDNYTYYSPAWGQWFIQEAGAGSQYLAVWVRAWSEGTTSWGYGPERFYIWAWGNWTIAPEPVRLADQPIRLGADHARPVVVRELESRTRSDGSLLPSEWYGWKDGQELTRLEPGTSNAWAGVVLYSIPKNAPVADLRACGWFGWYGTAIWYLTPHEVVQTSWEAYREAEIRSIIEETRTGLRTSDRVVLGRTRG